MTQKTLDLTKPVTIFNRTITKITFNEPTGAQYIDFGEPAFQARSSHGMSYVVENDQAIKSYLYGCIGKDDGVGDDGAAILAQLNFRDAVAAKRLVLSFFSDVVEALQSTK